MSITINDKINTPRHGEVTICAVFADAYMMQGAGFIQNTGYDDANHPHDPDWIVYGKRNGKHWYFAAALASKSR